MNVGAVCATLIAIAATINRICKWLAFHFKVPKIPQPIAKAAAEEGGSSLNVKRDVRRVPGVRFLKTVHSLPSYRRDLPNRYQSNTRSCQNNIAQYFWATTTGLIVSALDVDRSSRGTLTVESDKWILMAQQSPSCVLYQPIPDIGRLKVIIIILSAMTPIGVVLLTVLRMLTTDANSCGWPGVVTGVTLVVMGGTMWRIMLFVFRLLANTSNDYTLISHKSEGGTAWIAEISEGAFVGYEGIVFDLPSANKNAHGEKGDEGWILLNGHAQRSALAKLVRANMKMKQNAEENVSLPLLHWRPGQTAVHFDGSPHAFIFPENTSNESGSSSSSEDFPTHPRYSGAAVDIRRTSTRKEQTRVRHFATLVVAVQFHHGYFHWITERLPMLVRLIDAFLQDSKSFLLVDMCFDGLEDRSENRWPAEFLDLILRSRGADGLGSYRSRVVAYRRDTLYRADRIVISSSVPTFACHRDLLVEARDAVLLGATALRPAHSGFLRSRTDRSATILLIRRSGAARRLENLQSVAAALREHFATTRRDSVRIRIVDFEGMRVVEQISVCRNASLIIGVHGAGLANMVWCRDDACVIEILPKDPPFFRFLFWHLASSLGLAYYAVPATGSWSSREVHADPSHVVGASRDALRKFYAEK